MTKPDHVNTLISDIRDCSKRAHQLGYFQRAEMLTNIANELDQMANAERKSLPPLNVDNRTTRATATQHFQETQRLLKGIPR